MLIPLINHLLAQQGQLRRELVRFEGKVAEIVALPVSARFLIQADGLLISSAETPLTTLRFSPSLLPRLALRDESAYRAIVVEGDALLGAEIGKLLRNLRWDAAEDMSRLFGDVVTHRLTRFGAALFGAQGELLQRLAGQYAEHWTQERPLLARPADVDQYLQEVDHLRDAVERLEKRLAHLENRSHELPSRH